MQFSVRGGISCALVFSKRSRVRRAAEIHTVQKCRACGSTEHARTEAFDCCVFIAALASVDQKIRLQQDPIIRSVYAGLGMVVRRQP